MFGKDIVFTYGPLGFLLYCVNEGNNILIVAGVWLLILASHVVILYQYLFKLKKSEGGMLVLLSIFFYVISIDLVSIEYYLGYIALFSLMLVLNGYKEDIYLFEIIFISSLYIKFSLFIMVLGLLAIYVLLGYFYDKELYKYCFIRILAGIIISPLIYLLISGFSFHDFNNYIKGAIEITSGYNIAMSVPDYDMYVIWIIAAACAFLLCMILGRKSGLYNFMTMAFVGVCLFMCYKHGFVRADVIHIGWALNGMLVFWSIVLAFLQWNKIFETIGRNKTLYIILIVLVTSIAVIPKGDDSINIVQKIKFNIFDFPLSVKKILDQDTKNLNPLPDSMIMEIGDASVSIYPWEISYCVSNDLNYVPLATIQAYTAYTPYLDEISAEKILGSEAPEYILLTLDTIDNRWPLIECPQTWEAIRNNYYICMQEENLFLLKHRLNVNNFNYVPVRTAVQEIRDVIELDGTDYLKIHVGLNIKGVLAKIFWKIPEVRMRVYYSNGTEATHRVLLDMFSEGVELGTLVSTDETLIDVLNDTGHLGEVSKIVFEGDGLKLYKHIIDIEYYEAISMKDICPNVNIKTMYANEVSDIKFSSFEIREGAVRCATDLNVGNQHYSKITGWAYIMDTTQSMEQCEIYIEVGKKYYICNKVSREDVKEAFDLPTDLVGYSVIYDNGEVGNICIIDMENEIIYKPELFTEQH